MKWQPNENQTFCYFFRFPSHSSFFLCAFVCVALARIFKILRAEFLLLGFFYYFTAPQRNFGLPFTTFLLRVYANLGEIAGSVAENQPRSSNLIVDLFVRELESRFMNYESTIFILLIRHPRSNRRRFPKAINLPKEVANDGEFIVFEWAARAFKLCVGKKRTRSECAPLW